MTPLYIKLSHTCTCTCTCSCSVKNQVPLLLCTSVNVSSSRSSNRLFANYWKFQYMYYQVHVRKLMICGHEQSKYMYWRHVHVRYIRYTHSLNADSLTETQKFEKYSVNPFEKWLKVCVKEMPFRQWWSVKVNSDLKLRMRISP